MLKMARIILAALSALFVSAPAMAEVPHFVSTAASATAHGVEVAKDAVVHAAKVAASGVAVGAEKTGKAIEHAGKWVGEKTQSSSSTSAPVQDKSK